MQKTISYHTVSISYTVQGTGTPVVLLHGFGEDGHIWDEQVSFLQKYCQLIVPDLPGSGKSDILRPQHLHPPTPNSKLQTPNSQFLPPISIYDYADVIHALLLAEKITRCIMLGHSMGGYITLAFAEKYPQLLKSFGLVHSTAFADSEEKKDIRAKAIEVMGNYGAYAFLKNTIPNLFGKTFKTNHPEKINKLVAASAAFTVEALQQYYRVMMTRPDLCHVLKGNRLPVLFVMGTEDLAAPMEDVLKQVSLPEISYIHVLPGCGHMGIWEAPDTSNQILLAFINP